MVGKKQNISPTWKILMKGVDLGEPTSFLDHVYLGYTQRECQISKDMSIITEVCLNPEFLLALWKNYQNLKLQGNLRQTPFLHGPMTWKDMRSNAWKDIANLRTKQLSSCIKSQRHAWMTINSKKKKMDLLGNCPQFITNCCELFFFGPYWYARYFVVGEQACSCGHKMDKSL